MIGPAWGLAAQLEVHANSFFPALICYAATEVPQKDAPSTFVCALLSLLGLAGNKGQSQNLQDVKCWDDKNTIMIRVGDSCPCQQKKPDGTVQPQFWCCGGANHMDLSYW